VQIVFVVGSHKWYCTYSPLSPAHTGVSCYYALFVYYIKLIWCYWGGTGLERLWTVKLACSSSHPPLHQIYLFTMADEIDLEAVAALRKKRTFRKFTYKGLELEKLLDLSHDELLAIVCARARRRMQRGLKRKPMALIKKLRKVKAGKSLLSVLATYDNYSGW